MATHTTAAIAKLVQGQLTGPADLSIQGVESLDLAKVGQLTFIGEASYLSRWPESQASAALVSESLKDGAQQVDGKAIIYVKNADLAMAQVLELFAPPMVQPQPGIHASAIVDPTAKLGQDVRVGPGCVIGAHVSIGAGTVLQSSVTVMDHTTVGENCVFWPGVVVRDRCSVGNRCILHPNAVIGADGFGYRPSADGLGIVKIPQIGTVEIHDDVEIGAGTCVDRGKFSATVVGQGSKLDNLVQIGHNCRIGRCVVIAGGCAIAGSVTIGDGAMLGGMIAMADHLTIGRGARLAGGAQVMNDVPAGETWGGSPAQPLRDAVQQHLAVRKLPALLKQFKQYLKAAEG